MFTRTGRRLGFAAALVTLFTSVTSARADWISFPINNDPGDPLIANSLGTVVMTTPAKDGVRLFQAPNQRWVDLPGSMKAVAAGGGRIIAQPKNGIGVREWNSDNWYELTTVLADDFVVDSDGTLYLFLRGAGVILVNRVNSTDWDVLHFTGNFARFFAGGSKMFGVTPAGAVYEHRGNGKFEEILGPGYQTVILDDGTMYAAVPSTALYRRDGSTWTLLKSAPQRIFGRDRLLGIESGRLRMSSSDGKVWEDIGPSSATDAIVAGDVILTRGPDGMRRYMNTTSQTITVNSGASSVSSSLCTLRLALKASLKNVAMGGCPAGSFGQEDIIDITVPDVRGDNTQLDVAGTLSLRGRTPNEVTLSGIRMRIQSGSRARLERLSFQDTNEMILRVEKHAIASISESLFLDAPISHSIDGGAALFNSGDTNVLLTKFVGRQGQGIARGGIIRNLGTMRITHSSIERGEAATGGCVNSTGTLSLISSTVSNCIGRVRASAMWLGGPTQIVDTTITGNVVETSDGGTLGIGSSDVTMSNSIVAGNANPGECGDICGSVLKLSGASLIGHTRMSNVNVLSGSQKIGTHHNPINPKLIPVSGTTTHYKLQWDSPARDAGESCRAVDQLRAPRPVHTSCDLGSIETF